MKALYIIVNSGFTEQAVDFIRSKGVAGITIINARGVNSLTKDILGISADIEKEMILTITDNKTAEMIMKDVKQHSGFRSLAHGVCFALPVTKTVGISSSTVEMPEEN